MGKRFFKIVGVFSYSAATLALIAAIALGVIAGSNYFGSVDEGIAKPQATLEQYLREKNQDHEAQAAAKKKPPAGSSNPDDREDADREYQATLGPLFDRIVSSLDKFAATTNQRTVNRKGLEEYLIDNTEELDREEYLTFLKALANETEKLAEQAPSTIKDEPDSPSYVEWSEFVFWFATNYMQQYRAELGRIQAEQAEQTAERIASLTTAAAAAVAFLAFVFFTMILLLVQIELNTRKSH